MLSELLSDQLGALYFRVHRLWAGKGYDTAAAATTVQLHFNCAQQALRCWDIIYWSYTAAADADAARTPLTKAHYYHYHHWLVLVLLASGSSASDYITSQQQKAANKRKGGEGVKEMSNYESLSHWRCVSQLCCALENSCTAQVKLLLLVLLRPLLSVLNIYHHHHHLFSGPLFCLKSEDRELRANG